MNGKRQIRSAFLGIAAAICLLSTATSGALVAAVGTDLISESHIVTADGGSGGPDDSGWG